MNVDFEALPVPIAALPAPTQEARPDGARIFGIQLSAGTRAGHVASFVYVGIAIICIVTFFPLMQPYVLGNTLHIPHDHTGRVVGQLSFLQNMTVLVFVTPFGALADRLRCHWIVAFSYLMITIAAVLYPLGHTLFALKMTIVVLGIGQVANNVALVATTMSYPDNASRGKFGSFMALAMVGGTPLFTGRISTRLPALLKAAGFAPDLVIRYAFWIVALLGIPAIFLALFGLKKDDKKLSQGSLHPLTELRALWRGIISVLRHARSQPRFQFVLLSSLVTRSDFAVVATFLSLWLLGAGRAPGISDPQSMKRVGTLYTCIQLATTAGMIAVGFLLDRFSRVRLLFGSLILVTLALLSPVAVRNPFLAVTVAIVIFIGLSEGTLSTSMSTLLGQEAPTNLRGSTTAAVNLIGILSVAFINYAGGSLLDQWGSASTFLLMALLKIAIIIRVVPYLRHSRN